MKKLPFGKMLFLTLIAFFTFNTLNANPSIKGLESKTSWNDNGQTYTASLRCGMCYQSNSLNYYGYYMGSDETYFWVTKISCQDCGTETRIEKMYHISELDKNKIIELSE